MDKSNYETTISTSPSSFQDENEEQCNFPKDFDVSFPPKVIQAITRVLKKNEKKKSYQKIIRRQSKIIFCSPIIPSISLEEYLNRIIQMTEIEESIVVTALICLDRICSNKIALIPFNIHKLLFISIVIAIKYNHDRSFSNSSFSDIGGIPLEDINMMEYTFLKLLDYELFISEEFFLKYQEYISDISVEDNNK